MIRDFVKHFHRRLWSRNNFRSISNWIQPKDGFDTGIQIYNCSARRQIPLILKNKELATWYTCGPTVYDSSHIGHASSYVKLDIIQRILRHHFGIQVITAMNITDIDDKIIKRASESNCKNFLEISRHYESEFWNDLKQLNVQAPNIKLRVTENMTHIIAFIKRLIDANKAYIGSDGSVYFSVGKYSNYGKLQPINIDDEQSKDADKEAKVDFALWKVQKDRNEPNWSVPWSAVAGRPGWHSECSAMATKLFGSSIDIHAGGLDLKFPHHENEEAQSCCYHNTEQWVNYWIHTGHLNIKGDKEKMSKSLKNTISIGELLEKYTADEFRMACALSNYRNSMEFSDELMILAKSNLTKLTSFSTDCQAYVDGKKENSNIESSEILNKLAVVKESIDSNFKNDFDTSKSIASLINLSSFVSKSLSHHDDSYSSSSLVEIACVKSFIDKNLLMMGFIDNFGPDAISRQADDVLSNDFIDELVQIRFRIRHLASTNKESTLFSLSDELRDLLKMKNISIKDHPKGSTWKFLK